MKITICDISKAVCDACRAVMPPEIEVIHGSILDHEWDAVVSPANSFGFMDGGIDAAYTARFGSRLQRDLQGELRSYPFGELLVGQAMSIETGDPKIIWVISAPTMRVPMPIVDPFDIVLATRAAVGEMCNFDADATFAIPGMGTGAGGVPAEIAAKAMAGAIRPFFEDAEPPFPASWREAYQRHINLEG